MTLSQRHRRLLGLVSALLCLLAILSLLALEARQRFLTRGMPESLPGPNPHADISPYGINIELLSWDDAARQEALNRIAKAGFRWVKQPLSFSQSGGRPSWGESFDHLLQTAAELDLNVVPLLDGDPGSSFAPPADLARFAEQVGQFVARYGDQITYYQIWDEPNLGSHWGGAPVNPADYAALLAASHDAIIAADPEAVIVAAALAPTVETGPENLSDLDYLAALYELGADAYFSVAAGKPYGYDSGPEDRKVAQDHFNFSRLILLREVMVQHGDSDSALWAGNFGWNALPEGWSGRPSIWGQTDLASQAEHSWTAYQRALEEWPWAGVLFLENYAPDAALDDPRWGFALVNPDLTPRSSLLDSQLAAPLPNFQFPDPQRQIYLGDWEFQPNYGADISQSGDQVQLLFEGTDFGLRVRRGDYRAYFYVDVDGVPANLLPTDERGAYLCLTSPDRGADDVVTIPVAAHLVPGHHTAEIVAERGWDQWALVGFSAANLPDPHPWQRARLLLGLLALGLAWLVWRTMRGLDPSHWRRTPQSFLDRLGKTGQWLLAGAVAVVFALSGWFTWLDPAGSPFRRLGDGSQTLILAAVTALFYFSPWLLLNIASGLALFLLICWRLELGLVLIALSAPFYVNPKPLANYRFSLVEIVLLMSLAAWVLNLLFAARRGDARFSLSKIRERLSPLDLPIAFFLAVATLSLLFTERLDVASNEWRVVVVEPVLFYLLLRTSRMKRSSAWKVVDAFVLGGLAVAVLGLAWYAAGSHVITAEQGLPRLRSIYGSPNNVGLYLGRLIPILLAVALMGRGRRRWLYGLALVPVLAAGALSFSKGAILLGFPVGIGLVLLGWRGRKAAVVLGLLLVLALLALAIGSRIPALAGRLSLSGATTDFRLSLWKASVAMIKDHPWTGVGLDNFLYAYRGRYIRPEAWQEPNLSHPHNLALDYWTRLGILGLAAGLWIQLAYWKTALRLGRSSHFRGEDWTLLVALIGSMGAAVAHGLVDQSYFLIDLAYVFMLAAGLLSWLWNTQRAAAADHSSG